MSKLTVLLCCLFTISLLMSACADTCANCTRSGSYIDPAPRLKKSCDSQECDVPPRLLSGKVPVYPATRLLKGVDGSARIAYVIGTDGVPRDFKVLESDYEYFASHAIAVMKDWRFVPAMKDGRPVEVEATQTIRYKAR